MELEGVDVASSRDETVSSLKTNPDALFAASIRILSPSLDSELMLNLARVRAIIPAATS